MKDTKNWPIDLSMLAGYKENGWTENDFSGTGDGKYGIYIYNIDEWRMMAYAGLIAIYGGKLSQEPLYNSSSMWLWYDDEKTFDYALLSDCLIFKKPAYKENSNKPDFPFLLIKPTEKTFGFIEWDSTSIYYGFDELDQDKLIIKEVYPKDLENGKRPKRTGEIFDLKTINWFDMMHFDKAIDIYHEKTQGIKTILSQP